MRDSIYIKGARENNLKNIDLEIPREKLVVFTGLSGSGKSSLAFETIYAEGQRRYVESLSSYARMFLGQMDKPDVDYIEGLSPAISIDQKTTSRNPRSTVGTVTEIYDYLRLLWARIGVPHCPKCGREIRQQTIDQIVDQVLAWPEGSRIQVMAPVVRSRKGEHAKVLEDARKGGYVRVRVDGSVYDLSEEIKLDKNKKHNIEVVVDRLVVRPDSARRLTDSVETAASLAGGLVLVDCPADGREQLFSQNYACEDCGISIEELTPRMFSFNSPYGACPTCAGLGSQLRADPSLLIKDPELSILQGGLQAPGWANVKGDSIAKMYYDALAKKYHFKLTTPIKDLSKEVMDVLMYGTGGEPLELQYETARGTGTLRQPFEGLVNSLERRYRETQSQSMREEYEEYLGEYPCPDCGGKRLKKEALAVTVGGMSIIDFCDMPVTKELAFIEALPPTLGARDMMIADRILKEIRSRLGFLASVGLQYLTLSRAAATLSGGESQRIRLATQIGSSLMGVLYILDEPSIGLHQRDNDKLINTLKELRDLGNTLIVVEHDEETMRAADWIVDIGPGAGVHGGEVVAQGTVEDICAEPRSITGQYLSGATKDTRALEAPRRKRKKPPHPRREREQFEEYRRRNTARRAHGRHRRLRQRQVQPDKRGALQDPRRGEEPRPRPPRPLPRHRRARERGQGHLHRPVAHRAHPALEPRDLHGRVQRHPRALFHHAGRKAARLRSGALLLQHQGRPLRGLLRRRPHKDRDALPARHLRPLRRLQGQALQPRDAGGPLQGQEHR